MKIIFTFLVGITIFYIGCREGYELTKTTLIYGYDFTSYSSQGFLFTPESYAGEYESIGLVEMYLYPAVTNNKSEVDKSWDSWERSGFTQWYIGNISASELIDSLYVITKKMGADAVVRLTITETEPRSNGVITFYGLKASGFAIKRK